MLFCQKAEAISFFSRDDRRIWSGVWTATRLKVLDLNFWKSQEAVKTQDTLLFTGRALKLVRPAGKEPAPANRFL